MNLAYQEKNGLIRVGFLKKILWDGFSGTVDLKMVEEFLRLIKFKLKDGNLSGVDINQQYKRIVKRVTYSAEEDKDRPCCNGPIIQFF
ncbi:hypothetical protein N9305_00525 [Pelagibacteraceae bacterium]|nr:hypothetical protein [Pelagibacteraceae bacterium]